MGFFLEAAKGLTPLSSAFLKAEHLPSFGDPTTPLTHVTPQAAVLSLLLLPSCVFAAYSGRSSSHRPDCSALRGAE